jgi:hypothetical protein
MRKYGSILRIILKNGKRIASIQRSRNRKRLGRVKTLPYREKLPLLSHRFQVK